MKRNMMMISKPMSSFHKRAYWTSAYNNIFFRSISKNRRGSLKERSRTSMLDYEYLFSNRFRIKGIVSYLEKSYITDVFSHWPYAVCLSKPPITNLKMSSNHNDGFKKYSGKTRKTIKKIRRSQFYYHE